MESNVVVVCRAERADYSVAPPFHPSVPFPEYPFEQTELSSEANHVYAAVRNALALAGMDPANFGSPRWNPLGEIIRPGYRVLLKPNFVLAAHDGDGSLDELVTHGSVLRAIVDYVTIALGNEGEITIGDAPLQKGDFHGTCRKRGIDRIADFYESATRRRIELCDFRLERVDVDDAGVIVERAPTGMDRAAFLPVDLGKDSFLEPVSRSFERYRVTCYDKVTMARHHNLSANCYLIPKRVLDADVVINLPKLKTHRKAGITVCLKNLVGINGHKDWLPHHRRGSLPEGGDEYPHPSWRKSVMSSLWERRDASNHLLLRRAYSAASRIIRSTGKIVPFPDRYSEGSWAGNDTLWRTVLDLNRILLYCDSQGNLHESPQREYLALVDGIVAGEAEGPLEPDPKPAGVVVLGRDPVATDCVCASLMGFDYSKIPVVAKGFDSMLSGTGRPDLIQIRSNDATWRDLTSLRSNNLGFVPTQGWRGHIELDQRQFTGDAVPTSHRVDVEGGPDQ